MNHAMKWNLIDSIFFYCENKIKALITAIEDSSSTEPDVESVIAAETEYLQHENEKLKEREMPVYLIEDGKSVICPKCYFHLTDIEVKYCSNCGHRVIKHIAGFINQNNNITKEEDYDRTKDAK